MTTNNEQEPNEQEKAQRLSRPGRLELKRTVETGQVRQSFSHGRSRAVMVEVKRKRTYATTEGGSMLEVTPELRDPAAAFAEAAAVAPQAPEEAPAEKAAKVRRPVTLRALTDEEKEARARALQDARLIAEEARKEAEREAERRAEAEEAQRRAEQEQEQARRLAEEAAPGPGPEPAPAPEPETKPIEEEGVPPAAAEAKEGAAAAPAARKPEAPAAAEEKPRRGRAEPRRPGPSRRGEPRRRAGKLTIAQALDGGAQERMRSLAAVRRAREKEKQRAREARPEPTGKVTREVVVPETITVQELANRMAERGADVVKALMRMGVMATINQVIDGDTAELVTAEFGHRVKRVSEADVEIGLTGVEDAPEQMVSRAPVVTVMGHVDHGKTSLLDALRRTDVVSGEAGGITQHIGAYQVQLESGAQITFLDTPGHEAFSAMRARGANVTDIIVLVVAADDGVMEQTVEAIHHAQAAKVPIIVAINKIDKPDANPDRVRKEFLQHGIVLEEMGGDVLAIEVSAKEHTNLGKLEEVILLQAEMLELKANPNRAAEGVVIEAKLERGRGVVATVLVQRGTLKVGDIFIAGCEWGRVRALVDDHGRNITEAGPSVPVEVLGLNGMPGAGDDCVVVENESRAREVTEYRQRQRRADEVVMGRQGSVEQMISRIQTGEAKELPLVIKADVQGSVEAIQGSLEKLETEEVKVRILHSGIGGINESDVTLAAASKALVLGFNVRANAQARELARREGVETRYYSIIYDVINDIRALLSGMLAPSLKETVLGAAEIREVFTITKVGKVAGCKVTEGLVRRGAKARLLRDSVVIYEGAVASVRRFKEEVKEVREGYECGITLENYQDIQVGDVIECFEVEEIAREI